MTSIILSRFQLSPRFKISRFYHFSTNYQPKYGSYSGGGGNDPSTIYILLGLGIYFICKKNT